MWKFNVLKLLGQTAEAVCYQCCSPPRMRNFSPWVPQSWPDTRCPSGRFHDHPPARDLVANPQYHHGCDCLQRQPSSKPQGICLASAQGQLSDGSRDRFRCGLRRLGRPRLLAGESPKWHEPKFYSQVVKKRFFRVSVTLPPRGGGGRTAALQPQLCL